MIILKGRREGLHGNVIQSERTDDMKERLMKTANVRRWKTIFLALMIVFAASVTAFATSVTALAAEAEVTWV